MLFPVGREWAGDAPPPVVASISEQTHFGERLVMIDNYDSFTYNLVQLFYKFDLEVLVFRHDQVSIGDLEALKPRWLCISPGPKAPAQAGISKEVIARFHRDIPILGVCLGHQALNEVWGGVTARAPLPVHGKCSQVHHAGKGLFRGLPTPFTAARAPFSHGRACFSRPRDHGLDRRRRYYGTRATGAFPSTGCSSTRNPFLPPAAMTW